MRKLVVLLLFSLQACVSFPPADPNNRECVPKAGEIDPKAKTRPTSLVYTKAVRFTDDGEFVDRCEFSDALHELQSAGPQIVVVYVHGWKHNGDDNDDDLRKFSRQLTSIHDAEVQRGNARRVVGIYVAWNGKSTDLPIAKELTFWGRKRGADRVSQSGAVTRLLSAIDSIREKRNESRDLTIHVGHSFGARILYNAVAQGLIRQTELAHPGPKGGDYRTVRGFGDIVILLNPAFEASLFTSFDSLRRKEYRFPSTQPLLLISISSETDRATRMAFPIGQALSFNGAAKRRVTLGNFNDYRTHALVARKAGEVPDNTRWCSAAACLISLENLPEDNFPFISARADDSVMDGHNDVWNPNLTSFLSHLVAQVVSRRPGSEINVATSD